MQKLVLLKMPTLLLASIFICWQQNALAMERTENQQQRYFNPFRYFSWSSSTPEVSVSDSIPKKPSIIVCVEMPDQSRSTVPKQVYYDPDAYKLMMEKIKDKAQYSAKDQYSSESKIFVDTLDEAIQTLPYFSKNINTTLLLKDESQSEESANQWAPFYRAIQNVSTLAFPQKYLGFITVATWKNLAANSNLTTLENILMNNCITIESGESEPNKLLRASNDTIKRINFEGTIADVSLLFSQIEAFPQLEKLNLTSTLLNDKGLKAVAQLIDNAKFLESLKLSYFTPYRKPPFTSAGLHSFIEEHLKLTRSPLKKLSISTVGTASDCSEYMITQGLPDIVNLPYLEKLSFGLEPDENFVEEKLFDLGKNIAASKIKHLHVEFRGSDLQARKFFEGLGQIQPQNLESLHYEGPQHLKLLEGPMALAQFIRENKSLRKLHLAIPIADEAVKAMAAALQANSTLEHYIIGGLYPSLSAEGAQAISKALEAREIPLKSINLGACKVSQYFSSVVARGTMVNANISLYSKNYFR